MTQRFFGFGWRPGIDQVIAATNAKRCDLLRCLLTTFEIDRAGFGGLDIADIVEDAADDLLESLIGAGINPNGVRNSTPPIVISMRFGKYHFTELLLSHGADPNAVDPKTGNTALHEAMARAFAICFTISFSAHRISLRNRRSICADAQKSTINV